jgi:class 3 adenylate cyclase
MTSDEHDSRRKLRHDLRGPINQILGYSELLEEEVEERGHGSLVPDLQKIRSAARRLLELIDQALPPIPAGSGPPLVFRPEPEAVLQGDGSSPSLAPAVPDPAPLVRRAPGRKNELLVVDDNELNRDMLSRRLSARGYTVAVAEDGRTGLQLVSERRFDAVLLDVMMPGLSGLEVLKKLRETYSQSDLPVIMATARDASEDVVEALKLGANDYVTKPLDFPVVLARLENQLEMRRQKEEIRQLADELGLRNRFIQQTFGRYLSDEIVSGLLESPEGLNFGGEQRRVTLLMADLRGFSSLSEMLGPPQVVRLLNSYLGTMADIVMKHEGTVDEFIGDSILAIFGAPVLRSDDARRAVACAISMQLAMDGLNQRFRAEGLPRVEMGIALHTGDVVVGNIGSERRAKYGVVGSPVNHAGRIESFTVGGQVLISESTLQEAGAGVEVGGRITVEAKGAREPLTVYDVRGLDGEHGLFLPQRAEATVRLDPEVPARCQVLEGKLVVGPPFEARLVELSARAALLRTSRRLRILSNLKIGVRPGPGGAEVSGDLYAKVVEQPKDDGEGLYAIRFTSTPGDVETWLSRVFPGGS